MITNGTELLLAFLYSTLLTLLQLSSTIGVFILVGFIIAMLEKKRNYWIQQAVGRNGIYLTAIIGVPIHEIGHAIMCLLFGHRIESIKLIQFGAYDGTMGYVNHSYEPKNLIHRMGMFFIGIAPILMGIATITLSMWLFIPDTFALWWSSIFEANSLSEVGIAAFSLLSLLFSGENVYNVWFYVFLVIGLSIASHMTLSKPDILGARSGFMVLFVVFTIINVFQVVEMESWNIQSFFFNSYNFFLYSVSFLALFFAGFATLISYVLYRLKGNK